MSDYKEVTEVLEVPAHAGVEGFLLAMRGVLRLPRVTRVEVDASGKVSYTRWMREQEPRKNIEIDFDEVAPFALVRNRDVQELEVELPESASSAISAMFYAAELDHMYPVAFVTGANTVLYDWHRNTTGVRLGRENVYGLPVHRDRFVPDETLLLATSYARGSGLVDVQKTYKISMPGRDRPVVPVHEVAIEPRIEQLSTDSPLVLGGPPAAEEVKVTL